MIVIAKEPLGLRRSRLSLDLRLLVPTFSLPYAPVPLTGRPSPRMECSPTTVCLNFRGDRDASAVTRSLRAPPFTMPNAISDDSRDELHPEPNEHRPLLPSVITENGVGNQGSRRSHEDENAEDHRHPG